MITLSSQPQTKKQATDFIIQTLSVITKLLIKQHIVITDSVTKSYWQTEILENLNKINLIQQSFNFTYQEYIPLYRFETIQPTVDGYISNITKDRYHLNHYNINTLKQSLSEIYSLIFKHISSKTYSSSRLTESELYINFIS